MKLYSNGCPKCKEVEGVLLSKEITYTKISNMVDIMKVAQRELISQMPILEIEGSFFSGQDAVNKSKEI